jgi:hypothetical protein
MITDTPRCDAELRKSTKSGNTNCVLSAVCRCHGGALGDTKTSGVTLKISGAAHTAFIAAVRADRIAR